MNSTFKDYSPKSINDIVFQNDRSARSIFDIASGTVPFPASGVNGILLYGNYGTGKTSLARLLPDAIELSHGHERADVTKFDVQQGNDGAKVISTIKNMSQYVPMIGRYHYFVLDEVDLLKGPTMASLKSAMNAPETAFILTTNSLADVDMGVRNRCKLVEFNAAPPVRWLPLAKRILADRGVLPPEDHALIAVIDRCEGSARSIVGAMHELATRIAQNNQSMGAADVV